MSKTLITLDGPSGVGKTTIGKRLASELNFEFFSSGLLYRVIALHNEMPENAVLVNKEITKEALSDWTKRAKEKWKKLK